jgi:dTDP-L-rhamnose 4-epimerase
MSKRVLITGGAGFIGSHLADELLRQGHQVRVLDLLTPQVHGIAGNVPDYLDPDVELQVGDVRNPADVRKALKRIDAVYHFAAAVGVGQSMYEIAHYTSVNNLGTAVLLEALSQQPVERLVVASSMSIYGEGLYRGADGQTQSVAERSIEQLKRGDWELHSESGEVLQPVPTPETKIPCASSVYALSKYDQERLCLIVGGAYQIPTVALRFFNVYGPRQALSNPYTGVLAIFASRYLSGNPPLIYEDGQQQRDFVNVHDLVRGCRLALDAPQAVGEVINLGSGQPITVREVADEMATVLGREDLAPEVCRKYRVGDIRHCFADISKGRRVLGYEPEVTFREGLLELADWLEGQAVTDSTAKASGELAARGLMV